MEGIVTSLVQLLAVIGFSVLAFWRPHELLFLIVAGISLMVGLYWFDQYTTDTGLTISLMLIAYSFVSVGFGLKVMLWQGPGKEEE